MEQTKNEPTKENKAAPETGKPKKEREPLTEAQRLKRQKMIVLPAMVLVFIGAMWLIFAPSSGKEQQPGTDGYNTEMPDADKANKQIIGDKLKAYEHGEMEERLESRNRAAHAGEHMPVQLPGRRPAPCDVVELSLESVEARSVRERTSDEIVLFVSHRGNRVRESGSAGAASHCSHSDANALRQALAGGIALAIDCKPDVIAKTACVLCLDRHRAVGSGCSDRQENVGVDCRSQVGRNSCRRIA